MLLKEKISKFLFPVIKDPKEVLKLIFYTFVTSWYWVFNIFFTKNIVSQIELNQLANIDKMIYLFIFVSGLYFMILSKIRFWDWPDIYNSYTKILHTYYMEKYFLLDNTSVEKIWTGKILSTLKGWIDAWVNFLIQLTRVFLKLLISIITAFFLLYNIWLKFLFLFVFLFIWAHIVVFFINKIALIYRKWVINSRIEYDKQYVKMIMSKFEIMQSSKQKQEISVLDKHLLWIVDWNLNKALFTMFLVPDMVMAILIIAVFALIKNWQISYWVIVSLFMIISILKENLYSSITLIKDLTKNFYAIEKIWELIEETPKIKWFDTWADFKYTSWKVDLQNIDFAYWDKKVLNNFSLNLEWWHKIAFVWPSWWGKTTLVKLISGFITQDNWKIIVDNQDLSEVSLKSYYKNIWYLTQDPSVFDGSIRENLVYWIIPPPSGTPFEKGRKEFDELITESIINAGCEFIYELEKWLDTEIWERWVRLSGWQKQRLAIAKLFLKNPKIIILDEPTSALDSFSEDLITKSLQKLFVWKTVLIIAHRLQTVKNADEIIVIEDWNIIERWNHKELIEKNGYYNKMLEMQSGF